MGKSFSKKNFIIVVALVRIWVNISELARYLPYVRPEMMNYLSFIPNMGKMYWYNIIIWGGFDTLLTTLYVFTFYLVSKTFGNNTKSIWISGIMSWLFFFVLFWVGSANMFTAPWYNLIVVLPLALLETVIASYITSKLITKWII